jgi:hypothetical protein
VQLSIDELTVITKAAVQRSPTHSFIVGKCYLIRSVTMYYTGRLVSVTDTDLVLEDAAWVADTGRFAMALLSGELNEVEPFCDPVIITRGAIVDATAWNHPLPREHK